MASLQKILVKNDFLAPDEHRKPKLTREDIKDSKYAWIACICAVINQVFICGLLQIFGVYFVEFVKDFNSSQSQAAWLGSLTYGIMKLFGPVTGFFVVRFSNRAAMFTGCLVCASSLLISSYVKTMNVMYVSFSLLYGIGSSFVINCAMVLSNEYFDKHLGWATGLICAGSSMGTLILAPSAQLMIDHIGWRMSFRILMAIFIGVAVLNVFIRPMPKDNDAPQKENDTQQSQQNKELKKNSFCSLWRNRSFVLWSLATSFAMFGYYIPFVHLVAYGIDVGIPAAKASYFIMTLGASTTIGRLVSGKIVQTGYLNCLHLNQLCMILTGTLYMILPLIRSFGGVMTFVVILGLTDGCYVVLLPILTCSLVGVKNAILAWGMLVCVSSVTFTIGPPVAGSMYDLYGNYNIAFHIAGIPVICGALVLFFIPWARRTTRAVTVLDFISYQETIDSGNGLSSDLSDETIQLDILRKRGYLLPTGEVVPNVPEFLDTHFQNKTDQTLSTSLGDHRKQTHDSGTLQTESLPVPLNLMCGPDGMPVSIPSRMIAFNPQTSYSVNTRQSLTSSIKSRSPFNTRRNTAPQSVDASTQYQDFRSVSYLNTREGLEMTTMNTQNEWKGSSNLDTTSDAAPSEWSTRNNVGVPNVDTGTHTSTDRPGSAERPAQSSISETFESISLISDPSIGARNIPSSVSAITRDGEEIDMFKHIFKQDLSDTSL